MDGELVEAFDTGEGVVIGAVAGATEGLAGGFDEQRTLGKSSRWLPPISSGIRCRASARRTRSGTHRLLRQESRRRQPPDGLVGRGRSRYGVEPSLQSFPKVRPSQITVSVYSPGSSASEVNEDINRRLEEAFIGLEGIDRVQTTAAQGLGVTTLELKTFVNRENGDGKRSGCSGQGGSLSPAQR